MMITLLFRKRNRGGDLVSNPIVRRKEICIKHIEKASENFFLDFNNGSIFFCPIKEFSAEVAY